MSYSGKKTPLLLNAESQLTRNQGFRINPIAAAYQGTWIPETPYGTPVTGSYSQGTVTANTVLYNLTRALPNCYNLVPSTISVTVWRNLLKLGRPTDGSYLNLNCPALGNSIPYAFKSSYAGYGSFKKGVIGDSFYNETTTGISSTQYGLVAPIYPPYNYPDDGKSSYIYHNWSSTTPPTGATQLYQYFHEYAWITGWPGQYSWQAKTSGNPQLATDPVNESDTYAAAYYPRPDLAGSQPWRARDANKIEYDEYLRHGFIGTVARQAYYEFWSNYSSRRNNQYLEFSRSFQQNYIYQQTTNQKIASFNNTKTFIKGNYSNINDLTSSDIAGINLAFNAFGNDLIRLGKSLDLSQMHVFGLPSKFVLNLQKYNALTEALRMALLYSDLTILEINDILMSTYTPSQSQEKKIYNALQLIKDNDLVDIKTIVNCHTPGLTSLADLINPQKMFPNSYRSLTVPEYNINTLSAKNYDFIYVGNGVNSRIRNWGEYLLNILSEDMCRACGAFMATMNQIKNIRQMDVVKFSQVVANLEVTNKDLPLINSVNGTPGSVELADQELALIALGSGGGGNYRFADFLGAMSGWPYRDFFKPAESLIKQLQTQKLENVYKKLYQLSLGNTWFYPTIGKGYIDTTYATTIPYTIFKVTSSASVGAQTVNATNGINAILNVGNLITFSTSDSIGPPPAAQTYQVVSASATSISFVSILPGTPTPPYVGWPGLSSSVNTNHLVYVKSTYDGNYPTTTPGPGGVQDLIEAINGEIFAIQNANTGITQQLNYWWDKIGAQMFIEQRAIPFSITRNERIYQGTGREDIDTFVRSIEEYAPQNSYCGTAPILEAISDLTNIGGQSIVAAMREARNAKRIMNTGGELDNDVSDQMQISAATAAAVVGSNGTITNIEITGSGSRYNPNVPPVVTIVPQTGVFGTCIYTETAYNVSTNCTFIASLIDYPTIVSVKPGWSSGYGTVTTAIVNGTNYEITVSGACFAQNVFHTFTSPTLPPGKGATAVAVVDQNGSVSGIQLTNSGSGYFCSPAVLIDPPPTPPIDPPAPPGDGNFNDPVYDGDDPVPPDLRDPTDVYTVDEAIEEVTICNCDCWNE